MSALRLRKVPMNGIGSGDSCLEPDCNRKGRLEVSIAGYPLKPESRIAFAQSERLCPKHAKAWEEIWSELSADTPAEVLEAAA